MSSPRPPPSAAHKPFMDLEITVVSAKHLKNVNWRNGGDLKPYAVAYIDPDRRSATKPDDSGSTKPVWNERLVLPLPLLGDNIDDIFLTIDVFHSKPSETPKPLVGTAHVPLRDLLLPLGNDNFSPSVGPATIKTLDLCRPSGRHHGKLRLKFALRDRPIPPPPSPPQEQNYHVLPPPSYYYSTAPPPPPPRDYRTFSQSPPSPPPQHYPYPGSYSDPYSSPGYGYYSAPPSPPPTARPPMYYDFLATNYGGGPSAPADYTPPHEQKVKGGRMEMGAGLAVGAVAGALGRLALEEGTRHGEEKIAKRVESDVAARDNYRDYRDGY